MNNPISWMEYLPFIPTVVGFFQDLFEKTEEEDLMNQIKKYDRWHAHYIKFTTGGRKRKNMLTMESYLLLTEPLRKRLKEIRILHVVTT